MELFLKFFAGFFLFFLISFIILLMIRHYRNHKNFYHIKDQIIFMWEGSIEVGIIKYVYKEHVVVNIERFREIEFNIYKKDIISPKNK